MYSLLTYILFIKCSTQLDVWKCHCWCSSSLIKSRKLITDVVASPAREGAAMSNPLLSRKCFFLWSLFLHKLQYYHMVAYCRSFCRGGGSLFPLKLTTKITNISLNKSNIQVVSNKYKFQANVCYGILFLLGFSI